MSITTIKININTVSGLMLATIACMKASTPKKIEIEFTSEHVGLLSIYSTEYNEAERLIKKDSLETPIHFFSKVVKKNQANFYSFLPMWTEILFDINEEVRIRDQILKYLDALSTDDDSSARFLVEMITDYVTKRGLI